MGKNKEQDDLNKDFLKWLEEADPFGLNEDIKIIIFKCIDQSYNGNSGDGSLRGQSEVLREKRQN